MDLFKLPPTFMNRLRESEPLNEITLSLETSFPTTGLVKYTDVTGRKKIIEFVGKSWVIDLLLKKGTEISFSAFINNPKKKEDQILTLTKTINNNIVSNKIFEISVLNEYDGWFTLE